MPEGGQRGVGRAPIDGAARNLDANQAFAMREIVGREGLDILFLPIIEPIRHTDEEDVQRLPGIDQRNGMPLVVVGRNGRRRHGPVDVGTGGQRQADQGECRETERTPGAPGHCGGERSKTGSCSQVRVKRRRADACGATFNR